MSEHYQCIKKPINPDPQRPLVVSRRMQWSSEGHCTTDAANPVRPS